MQSCLEPGGPIEWKFPRRTKHTTKGLSTGSAPEQLAYVGNIGVCRGLLDRTGTGRRKTG
jgi:hypothetical protein